MTFVHGHRGAKGKASENTPASFQRYLEYGINRCELDLHLSCDGELTVIHNPALRRITDRRGKTARHDAATLITYDAREGGPDWVRSTPTPQPEELFEKYPLEHW